MQTVAHYHHAQGKQNILSCKREQSDDTHWREHVDLYTPLLGGGFLTDNNTTPTKIV